MGSCYIKQCSYTLNPSEIIVFETAGKKEEEELEKLEKGKIIKIDIDKFSDNAENKFKQKKSSKKKVRFSQDTINNDNEIKKIEKIFNDKINRRVRHKIINTLKTPQELMNLTNKLKIKTNNNDSINNDKESIFNFNSQNGSEISQSSNIKEHAKKKFKRKKQRSVTRIDKTQLSKKLVTLEQSIPVLTEKLIIQQKGNLKDNYEIIKKIGNGPLGSVYKAKNIYLKNIVAIKIIKKKKENKEENDDSNITKQINILRQLNHPNIVKIHEFYVNEQYYQIITEYFNKGELLKYIKGSYSEKQLAVIFYQIISGLGYLHSKKITHKNIKLKNIMILEKEQDIKTKEEYLWIKIVDFHTAEIIQRYKKNLTLLNNSYYSPPETINNIYTEKSDLWSVGVILHIALTGKVPFDGKTDEEINYKILNSNYNDLDPRLLAHSSEVKDLLDKLLTKEENKRLSAEEALNHEWFKKYQGRALFSNFLPDQIQLYINNLCNYSCESKISQLVLAFLVHNLPQTISIYIILKLFRYFNLSGNCKLTKMELKKGLYNYRNKDQVDKIVDQLFLLLDGDNNGYIESEEFIRACVDKKQILTKENIWYAFKFLDNKNENSIDVQTLMNAFDAKPNKMLEAVFNKTLNKGDIDNNGKITFREFEQILEDTMK